MTIQTTTDVTVELIDSMGSDVSLARAAWISTGPDEREKEDGRIEGLLRYLMKHRHGTPFEHATVTFRVSAPIMVFREWHRHRVQSYNEQSGRYSVFTPEFYIPGPDRPLINIGTSARPVMGPADPESHRAFVDDLIEGYEAQWKRYEHALNSGISNEMARLHLPVAIVSNMYATANLRAWLHFLGLRTSEPNATFQGHPQWEIVQAAKQVEQHLRTLFPITLAVFDEQGRVAP